MTGDCRCSIRSSARSASLHCITRYRIKSVLSNMECVHWRSYSYVFKFCRHSVDEKHLKRFQSETSVFVQGSFPNTLFHRQHYHYLMPKQTDFLSGSYLTSFPGILELICHLNRGKSKRVGRKKKPTWSRLHVTNMLVFLSALTVFDGPRNSFI